MRGGSYPSPQWWPPGSTLEVQIELNLFLAYRHPGRLPSDTPPVFTVFPTFGKEPMLLRLVAGAPCRGLALGALCCSVLGLGGFTCPCS